MTQARYPCEKWNVISRIAYSVTALVTGNPRLPLDAGGAHRSGGSRSSRNRFGGARHGGCRGGRGHLGLGFLDVDAAFEQSTILNADARSGDVADEFGILADVHLVAGLHVALYLAQDDHFPGPNAGLNPTVRANRYLILQRFDGPFDIAVDVKIFLGEDLANNLY